MKVLARYWLPVICWMGFIFTLSCVAGKDIPKIPIPYFHKVVHFTEYSVLGALLLRAFLNSGLKSSAGTLMIFSIMICALFALSDEWHQTFVPGRSGKLGDAVFDMVCASIGAYLCSNIIRKR